MYKVQVTTQKSRNLRGGWKIELKDDICVFNVNDPSVITKYDWVMFAYISILIQQLISCVLGLTLQCSMVDMAEWNIVFTQFSKSIYFLIYCHVAVVQMPAMAKMLLNKTKDTAWESFLCVFKYHWSELKEILEVWPLLANDEVKE
jgi:hypothetical protein